jgi:hypothetical protein
MATPPEAVEGRNRNVDVALVAVLLIVILVALWFAFLRGDGDDETALPVSPPAAVENSESEPALEPTSRRQGTVETFEVFAPKDPFEPLVNEGGGGGSTTGGTTTGGEPNAGAAVGPAPSAGGESVGGHRVRLVDVFTQGGRERAQVQVDGTVYTVDEGETFAENFELLSVSDDCATMLFGDDQFTMCEGEEILK